MWKYESEEDLSPSEYIQYFHNHINELVSQTGDVMRQTVSFIYNQNLSWIINCSHIVSLMLWQASSDTMDSRAQLTW
jgi:hypothetical protein